MLIHILNLQCNLKYAFNCFPNLLTDPIFQKCFVETILGIYCKREKNINKCIVEKSILFKLAGKRKARFGSQETTASHQSRSLFPHLATKIEIRHWKQCPAPVDGHPQ